MRLLIMGPPGSGKGTQAVELAQRIGAPHISTGDLFRAHVRDRTELGLTVQGYLDEGAYAPDAVTNAMVEERLGRSDALQAFVLDGYPRTTEQIVKLDQILEIHGTAVEAVVELVVDETEVVGRLLERARTSGRTDDTEEVIRHRQDVYAAETAPLIDIYEQRGLLVRINGLGQVEDVADRINQTLMERQP